MNTTDSELKDLIDREAQEYSDLVKQYGAITHTGVTCAHRNGAMFGGTHFVEGDWIERRKTFRTPVLGSAYQCDVTEITEIADEDGEHLGYIAK